ncbi:ribonuclease E inhibitor RraB, partial [Enterobacter hormaechei]|uniref:ribonuclease E inhibitor RraB n=1 Tax=Enterobacter hormaechei TaxID=158836 RepID=UPI00200E7B21
STSDLTTWQAVAALEGNFEFGGRDFDWEAGYQYNRSELTQRATGNLHKQRVADATGPSFYNPATGKVECGTPDAPIAGCKPWNPLVPYGQDDPYGLTGNTELQDWLFPEELTRGRTTTRNLFANLRENTDWDITGPLLWGYFFVHSTAEPLQALAQHLQAQGYTFVELFEQDPEEGDAPFHVLHVERVEIHDEAS